VGLILRQHPARQGRDGEESLQVSRPRAFSRRAEGSVRRVRDAAGVHEGMDFLHYVTTVVLVLVFAFAVPRARSTKSPGKADLLSVDLGDLYRVVTDHRLDGLVAAFTEASEEAFVRTSVGLRHGSRSLAERPTTSSSRLSRVARGALRGTLEVGIPLVRVNPSPWCFYPRP